MNKIDITMCKQVIEVHELDPENHTRVASNIHSDVAHDHTYTRLIQHPLTNTFDRQACLKATLNANNLQ